MTTPLPSRSDRLPAVAVALRTAEESGSAVEPPSATVPGLTLDDAYAIQRANLQHRLDGGERVVGRKVGLTSLAMQTQLGVDQPDFGTITDRMVIADGGSIDVTTLIAPRIEAEFAFRIGTDLPPSPTRDQLVAAVDGIAVALEIIDSRVADWKIGLVDTVADNASSARIVHGAFVASSPRLLAALPGVTIHLTQDGEHRGSGPGSAVLGDPLTSLLWLATALGGYGDAFAAGDVVLAGAVAAAVPLSPGSVFAASADGFGAATVHTTSGPGTA